MAFGNRLCPVSINPILVVNPIARSHATATINLFGALWLDMHDRPLVMVMAQGVGAHLSNDEKRAHLTDLKREHLID